MKINELVKEVHETAKEKGWWDSPRSPLEIHALIHAEVAEATEEARQGNPNMYLEEGKPEGELIELADAIIRIADWCGFKGWDLEEALKVKIEYNKTRSYRHGNKKF